MMSQAVTESLAELEHINSKITEHKSPLQRSVCLKRAFRIGRSIIQECASRLQSVSEGKIDGPPVASDSEHNSNP